MTSPNWSAIRDKPLVKSLQLKINEWLKSVLDNYHLYPIRKEKVIRDPILGFNRFFEYEINLIDSPVFQRLRNIHQTALSYYTYPTATHTRFDHSLGCTVIADRMVRAINDKHSPPPINSLQRIEIRLAGLLHDIGHGPFSHASEYVYDTLSVEIQNVRSENQDIFGKAAGHEILSMLIVTSPRFGQLWENIIQLYAEQEKGFLDNLDRVNLENVGSMIIGFSNEDCPVHVAQLINGPFDADKFDYIIRDGYFSGLVTTIDIDRLNVSLDYDRREKALCIDINGATILEQLLFNKMILFSSMYHHHKVRASFRELVNMLKLVLDKKIQLNGKVLESAADFLYYDDNSLLNARCDDAEFLYLKDRICNRKLLKRALVIYREILNDVKSKKEWLDMQKNLDQIATYEKIISDEVGLKAVDICIDFPPSPRIEGTAKASLVRVAADQPLVSLDSLYPTSGWMKGYEIYRYRTYVFCPEGFQAGTAEAAVKCLKKAEINLNSDLSMKLAKWK